MMFVTGPLFSGKRTYVKEKFGWDDAQLANCAKWDVQQLAAQAEDLSALAQKLSEYPAVIATETGGGVVPIDPQERRAREQAGRLACLLAAQADTVVRMFCGIPTVLKGAEKL